MAQDIPPKTFKNPIPFPTYTRSEWLVGLVIVIVLMTIATLVPQHFGPFAVSKCDEVRAESPMTNSEFGSKVSIIREGTWIDTANDSYFYERLASDTAALREGKVLMLRRSDGRQVAVQVTFRDGSVFVRDLDSK